MLGLKPQPPKEKPKRAAQSRPYNGGRKPKREGQAPPLQAGSAKQRPEGLLFFFRDGDDSEFGEEAECGETECGLADCFAGT